MRAPLWRTLRLALACAFASLLIPAAAPAQLGGLNIPDVEVPPVPDPPLQTSEIEIPSAEELLDTVEQGTGVDVPGVGSQPSGEPPASTPAGPASDPFANAPTAPQAEDPQGGTTTPGPSGTVEPSPSTGRAGRTSDASGPGANAADGVGAGRASRDLSGASATRAVGGEGSSPVRRVFEAIGDLPWTLMAAIAALAGLGVLMAGRSAWLSRLTRRLTNQGEELREDVGALQTAILPTIPERIGSVGLSVAYRAAEGPAAGGDFHDVLPLEAGRIAIVVGDVSGHGREALAVTPLVHYTVRAYLEAGMQPRQALRLADGALGGKLGSDFATVLAAIYDPESSTLDYATAGHPAPVILDGERDHFVTEMTPPPIGVGPPTGFRQTRVELQPGSAVCFFTDGLIERRDEDGAMVGHEGLAQLLAGLGDGVEAEAALDRLAQSSTGDDDMTVCLMRPEGAAGDGSVVEELELDAARAVDGLNDFLEACGLPAPEADRAIDELAGHTDAAPSLLRVRRRGDRSAWEIVEAVDQEPLLLSGKGNVTETAALAG